MIIAKVMFYVKCGRHLKERELEIYVAGISSLHGLICRHNKMKESETSKMRNKRRKQQKKNKEVNRQKKNIAYYWCWVGSYCLQNLYPCWILISTFMLVPAFAIAEGSVSKGLAIVLMRHTWSQILFKPPSALY